MRFLVLIVLVLSQLNVVAQSYTSKLQEERDSINAYFSDTATTILPENDLEHFYGLNFYPIDTTFKVEARFKKHRGKPFEMATSTDRLPVYRKYGVLKFQIGQEKCRLYVYERVRQNPNDTSHSDYVFCPFRDLTNEDSTYGGGRYLDFKIQDLRKQTIIDFNRCYNPYCAYNDRYSCPVPPKENKLDVRIEAGVKRWHD